MRVWTCLLLGLAGTAWPCGAQPRWQPAEGYRHAPLAVPREGRTGFALVSPPQSGVWFTNRLTELEAASNRVLLHGSGVAAGDFDGDGRVDLFFCGLNEKPVLYRNLGDWRFEDVTARAGLDFPGGHYRAAVFADLNGNGHLDLLVAENGRGVHCFLNLGAGRFENFTDQAGTRSPYGSLGLSLADVDGNGTLDLYVTNYRDDDILDYGGMPLRVVDGRVQVPAPFQDRLLIRDGKLHEVGQPDQLYLNDGTGRFTPVSWTGGAFLDAQGHPLTAPPMDWGLTMTFRDMNGDGWPDIYVCNDFWTPDRIWINRGDGRFQAIAPLAVRRISASSMGVDFTDLDRDGHLDFFVVDMLSRDPARRKQQFPAEPPAASPMGVITNRPHLTRNTLFRNRGDFTFEEIADFAGLAASDWSWSPVFLDVDLDGYDDVLITAGHYNDLLNRDADRAVQSLRQPPGGGTLEERRRGFARQMLEINRRYPPLDLPIVAFRNRGDLTFEETTSLWGTDQPGIHHGLALADLDGDGDLDLIVNNLNAVAGLYENLTTRPRVAVRLIGRAPNTGAIGAQVTLLGGAVPRQTAEVISGGRYLSGADTALCFAAGTLTNRMEIEVRWRNGGRTRIPNVRANTRYEFTEPADAPATGRPAPTNPPPLFADVSRRIDHRHHENEFDDFAREPLLPFKLSQPGPGVAWHDLNGNGLDDLIIGAGVFGHPAVYLNDGQGGFRPAVVAALEPLAGDVTSIVAADLGEGTTTLLLGMSGHEYPAASSFRQFRLEAGALQPAGGHPGDPAGAGPLALCDYDLNGRMDLFVGGQPVAGAYPRAGRSLLLEFDDGAWTEKPESRALFPEAGLVNGAVWSDLDGDGYPELILATEWGPIRVFYNQAGRLRESTRELGLADHTGLWKGVTTGDLDGDGRLDIIAANWGLNSPFAASPEQPLVLYHGDLIGGGNLILETEYEPFTGRLLPRRDLDELAPSLPFLRVRFFSYRSYSETDLTQLLGDHLRRLAEARVTTLASTVFLNRGGRFEAVPLPYAAQIAAAFSVQVADLDGDGHEDVFLTQNFFATRPGIPRLDAGRALWLRGDGTGRLVPVPGQDSGILVYGEQRGAALADFDRDGRVDLAISQNAQVTKLYRNQSARPGVRIRLRGPPGNTDAFGAVIRLRQGDRLGPARAVHGGSGYLSQDSPVQVLSAAAGAPTGLWVRWPGGRITEVDLPRAAREVTVGMDGRLKHPPNP
jgi:enediyne biosynthesis protein E4